jgi:hypothetical protein
VFGKFLRVLSYLLTLQWVVAAPSADVHVVGTGPDVSYVVIQEQSLSATPLIFAYHYTFASTPPISGYALLSRICSAYPDLLIATTQYSFGKSLDAFDYRGHTVTSSTAPDGNSGTYWSYYVSGGYDGSGAITSNSWNYSQFGFESRTITPGSCDGWTFASWEGTNEPTDVAPSLDVTNVPAIVVEAAATPTPTPSPTATPAPTPATSNPLAISVGAGPDVSFVVIQSDGLSPRPVVFAFHYTNSAIPPMTGYGLLLAIRNAVPEFDFATTQYTFGKSLDAFRLQGTTVTSSTAPDGNSGLYWSYYLCGGYDGKGAVSTNGWSYSQYGFESRTITPGSCDGWTIASWEGTNGTDLPPTVDPTFLSGLLTPTTLSPGAQPTPLPSGTSGPKETPEATAQTSPQSPGSATPSPASTPSVGTNGGGAFYGGPIPSDVPRSGGMGPSRSETPVANLAGGKLGRSGANSSGAPVLSISSPESGFLAVVGGGGYSQPGWFQSEGFVEPVGNSIQRLRSEDQQVPVVPMDQPMSREGLLSSYRQALSASEPPASRNGADLDVQQKKPPVTLSQNLVAKVWNHLTGHFTKAWSAVSQWVRSIPWIQALT